MRNVPVIMGNRRIGLLLGMRFDLCAKQAAEIIIACGLRGKRRIDCRHIAGIADGFILVDDTARIIPEHDGMKQTFAFDTTGVLIGCISDYAVDQSSMRILAVEIATGYYPRMYAKRIWVFEYECINPGEILLPASICFELIESKKEEEMCVFRQ